MGSPSNPFMKQPTNQEERNEDKKKPEKDNPSHGIDPKPEKPEMEVDQEVGGATRGNRTRRKTIRGRREFHPSQGEEYVFQK